MKKGQEDCWQLFSAVFLCWYIEVLLGLNYGSVPHNPLQHNELQKNYCLSNELWLWAAALRYAQ